VILLVNPRATEWRCRIPLSILSIGASLEGRYSYDLLDGNVILDLAGAIRSAIRSKKVKYVGFTVMPGPQLPHAIHLSRMIRREFPDVAIIWGGYFSSLHTTVVLGSPYVDFAIRDQGDLSFRSLVDALESGASIAGIRGLSYKAGDIRHNGSQELIDPNTLPPLPYWKIDISPYIGRTYVGTRTVNYHSSVGCPFLCGFCAVAAVYKARWMGLPAERIVHDLLWFQQTHAVNAVEFHDNNFFTSERRTAEFADRIKGKGFTWWGEGRPDTLLAYDDSTWRLMAQAGSKMIFFGAESSSQKVLSLMEKGGTQTPDTVLHLAEKLRSVGIIPEFSFVLGSPTETVSQDLEMDLAYIMKIKKINPNAEIIIYIYSPVHFEQADLYRTATSHSFAYPKTLDDWLLPQWQMHDLRKNPVTPWLVDRHVRRIRNFERVLNARFPTVTDLKLRPVHRSILKMLGSWRYKFGIYLLPLEVHAAQKLFRYRRPEIEGF